MSGETHKKTDRLSEIQVIDVDKDWNGKRILNPNSNADKMYVSDTKGSDTLGDGSRLAPYKTLQKAIDVADAITNLEAVVIELDTNTLNPYSGSIPDLFPNSTGGIPISIISPQAYLMGGVSLISTLEIGQQVLVSLDNLTIETIKEPSTGSYLSTVYVEECRINNIEDDGGGAYDDLNFYFEGTFLSGSPGSNALTNVLAMHSTSPTKVRGEVLSDGLVAGDNLYKFNPMELLNQPIRGAQLEIIQDAEESVDSTSSTGYQQACRFSKTLETAKYLVQVYCEIEGGGDGGNCNARVEINDTTEICYWEESDDYSGQAGIYILDATAGTYNFDFDFKAESSGPTVYIRRKRIVLMKVVE